MTVLSTANQVSNESMLPQASWKRFKLQEQVFNPRFDKACHMRDDKAGLKAFSAQFSSVSVQTLQLIRRRIVSSFDEHHDRVRELG